MNINREERQQMRQRGAASRKTKDINFGFSFGLAPPPPDEAADSASRPADVGIAGEPPALPPPPPPTTTTTTTTATAAAAAAAAPPITTKSSSIADEATQNGLPPAVEPSTSQNQEPARRTSGSPRTRSSPRLSSPKNPSDDATEAGPSRKIRKLDHPRSSPTTSAAAHSAENPPSLANGIAPTGTAQSAEESTIATEPVPKPVPAPASEALIERPASPVAPAAASIAPNDIASPQAPQEPESAAVATEKLSSRPKSASPRTNGTPSPSGKKARGKRKRQGSQESKRSSPTTTSPKTSEEQIEQLAAPMDTSLDVQPETTEPPTTVVPDTVELSNDTILPDLPESTEPVEPLTVAEPQLTAPSQETTQFHAATEPQPTTKQSRLPIPSRTKRPRGERAASVQPSTTTVKEPRVTRAGSAESAPVEAKGNKRIRTRVDGVSEQENDASITNGEPEGQSIEVDAPQGAEVSAAERKGARRGRPLQLEVAEMKPKRAGRPGRKVSPSLQDVVEEEEAPAEKAQKEVQEPEELASQPMPRGRRPKASKPQPVEPEPSQPEPEPQEQALPSEAQPKRKGRRPKQAAPEPVHPEPEQAEPAPQPQDHEAEAETASRSKLRGRGAKPTIPAPETAATAPEPAISDSRHRGRRAKTPEPEPVEPEPVVPESKLKGRRARTAEPEIPQPETRPAEQPMDEPVPRSRGRRTRTAEPEAAQAEHGPANQQPAEAEPRRRGRRARTAEPDEPQPQPDPEPATQESVETAPKPRGRKARGAKSTPAKPAEAVPEPEGVEPEVAQPEPEPESSQAPAEPRSRKRDRGGRQAEESAGVSATREADNVAAEGEGSAEPSARRRKPRQPRGETVPVTVHRLANVAALGGDPTLLESSDDEGETAEASSDRQQAKLPSRGGVNVADVLGQICRETLEKTLTTLTNGIDGEGNAARRAEWTRKKKVVEAYGSELEGRLLELSEMLDGNFVLGVKMRKAKREMMEYRSRLYQVRKEREAVALQMDAVRRKHAEDESARKARSTINNSLHSLDLALERRQTHPADPNETTDLGGMEFLLRNVAETVSSAAPGGQGGLLHQLRSFNAQLESTARRLES